MWYRKLTAFPPLPVETVGYIARAISTQNVDKRSIYVLQFSLTVLAPVLVAGFCYILFGRITFFVVPRESRSLKLLWVHPRLVTPLFVSFDVIALLLQLAGAVMISSTQATDSNARQKINHGKAIAQTGVVVQLVAFGFFSIIAIRFNFTSERFKKLTAQEQLFPADGNDRSLQLDTVPRKLKDWPAILRVVNIVSGLILVSLFVFFCHVYFHFFLFILTSNVRFVLSTAWSSSTKVLLDI